MTEPLDKAEATFAPARTDDLRPGVAEWVGRRGIWRALWLIEDGPYAGQFAWAPPREWDAEFGWVPTCDLTSVTHIYPDSVCPCGAPADGHHHWNGYWEHRARQTQIEMIRKVCSFGR